MTPYTILAFVDYAYSMYVTSLESYISNQSSTLCLSHHFLKRNKFYFVIKPWNLS